MENLTSRQPVGNLKISRDVIAAIARVAALEVEGVDSLAEPEANIKGFFSRALLKKAIHITMNDDFAVIDVCVNLKFGAKINAVCTSVQNNIKDNVQTMTGMAVAKVNVLVAGIVFTEEDAAE